MRKLVLFGLVAALLIGLFLADGRNRTSLTTVLENAASAKPVMQGVKFRMPFMPDAPTEGAKPTLYPKGFDWLEAYVMKYYELGEGYWQTRPLDLLNGVEVDNEDIEEYRGHFRFKFNPPDDPLHPGHAMVATNSDEHKVWFAHLRGGDFDALEEIPANAFHAPAAGELSAAWELEPGDTIGIKIDTKVTIIPPEATGSEAIAEGTQSVKPRVERRVTYAKLYIRKLSHNDVQFDYLHRTDGKTTFPRPNPAARQ